MFSNCLTILSTSYRDIGNGKLKLKALLRHIPIFAELGVRDVPTLFMLWCVTTKECLADDIF